MDEHLIEAILLDDGGRKHTRQEIFAYFQDTRDITARTEFLKNSYNDIWVEVLAGADKVRVGYHAEEDGLLMWEGSYLSRTAESVFSWGVVTEMTENLIERGEYKIKLGLQNAPVMEEQLSFFDMGGGAAVYEVPEPQRTGELFPIRTVPQAVIDQALYTAGNSYNSAYRVAVFYARQRSETECIAFLRREFGTENGRGIEYEGQKYAVWFMEDGIHLAQGDSIRTSHSRTTVTWEQASARILELLEAGTYLSAAELEQTREHTLLEMAEELMLTVRELTEEGRRKGLFAQTLVIHDQRKSYPELAEDVVASPKVKAALRYWQRNTKISSAHTSRIAASCVFDCQSTAHIGSVWCWAGSICRSAALPRSRISCAGARCSSHGTRSTVSFWQSLRTAVWTCIPSSAIPAQKRSSRNSSKAVLVSTAAAGAMDMTIRRPIKGLTYQREYARKRYDEVKLTIPNVVKEYERLIAQKRFPGEDAIAAIPQYERRQLARTVYFGFSDAPDDVPRPYPKGADYYDAVPVIEEQLADKAKAAEMLEALTAYLDGMDEGDRHYDSCQQAREQLSEYVDGTFSLFNHRHDSGLRQAEREATPITPTGEVGVTEEPAQEQEISPLPQVQQREEAPQGQAAMPPVPHLPRKKRAGGRRPAVGGRRQLPHH